MVLGYELKEGGFVYFFFYSVISDFLLVRIDLNYVDFGSLHCVFGFCDVYRWCRGRGDWVEM